MFFNQAQTPYVSGFNPLQQAFVPFNANYAAKYISPVSSAISYRFQPVTGGVNFTNAFSQPVNSVYSWNPGFNQSGISTWNPSINQTGMTGINSWSNQVGVNAWNPASNQSLQYSQSFVPANNWSTGTAAFNRATFGVAKPTIDISETNNDIVLACDLPNVNLNDLNLTVSENACSISAQSFVNGQNLAMHRTVPLPTSIRSEAVDANYSNGILQIRMPKKDVGSRREIKVNVNR